MSDLVLRNERFTAKLARRHRAEKRFRRLGMAAVVAGVGFLAVLFGTVTYSGVTAFEQTVIRLDVHVDPPADWHGGPLSATQARTINTLGAVKKALRETFPEVKSRHDRRQLTRLISLGASFQLRDMIRNAPDMLGQTVPVWVIASDDVDMLVKGVVAAESLAQSGILTDRQQEWVAALKSAGQLKTRFNWTFFTAGDSREPEQAGIAVAVMGSLFSIIVCLAFAFPFGLMAAVYLEEFAPKNRWTEFIEVNINNLAAVPSIVFGLLGLAVFLNFFNLPRSSPLVGGIVLALMTLPTIIIAGRAALKAVPPSIREAALAVGASPVQAVFHHVVPLAMPGTLTGTIIGTARALGETAPLLMIGMVAFVVDIPENILSAATALPVQVFLWADNPERAFLERTSAATLTLLLFTCVMNLAAVLLRRKLEIRW